MMECMSHVQGLLRKLIDGIPTAEIETEVVNRMADLEATFGTTRTPETRELETVADLSGLVDRLRRRARELRALYETAGDLSAARDLEDVLEAIVRRARLLLDTDLAYLMLVDDSSGDTYMRVTEGIASMEFREARLPPGEGLAGRIAASGGPVWTRNYLADERHLRMMDDTFHKEQVVALLGVPLLVGKRVLGVLFAGERRERDYSPEEVALLTSLANHAALAVVNASRLKEAQDALSQLSAATAEIEYNNSLLEQAITLHERLTTLVIEGGSAQDLAAVLSETLHGSVLVRDDLWIEIARSTAPGHERIPFDQIQESVDEQQPSEAVRVEIGDLEATVLPVIAANDRLGTLMFVSAPVTDETLRSLQRGASAMALLLLIRRAADEVDSRVRGEILADLLARSPTDADQVRRRATRLNVDMDQPMRIVAIVPRGEVQQPLRSASGRLARTIGALVASYSDRVVMLVPDKWSPTPAQEIAQGLRHLSVTVAASSSTSNLAGLVAAEASACRSARLLIALGRQGEGASADALGVLGLLLSDLEPGQIASFVDRNLKPIRDYDQKKKTELLLTMENYFQFECNVAATAEAMFIHVNTVYQRLDRLDRLLGRRWRAGDQALELRLALRMAQLIDVDRRGV